MRLIIRRQGLEINPEGPLDEAFIEEVLRLKMDGDAILLRRANALGLSSIACLETVINDVPRNIGRVR